MKRKGCGVWVLGDVSADQIAAAEAQLPRGAILASISDEGTIGYFPADSQIARNVAQPRRNWLKEKLR